MINQLCQQKKKISPSKKFDNKTPSDNVDTITPTLNLNGNGNGNGKTNQPQLKICNKCGVEKSLRLFYKDNRSRDGRRSDCAECNNTSRKQYQKLNIHAVLLKNEKWRNSNIEHVEEWKKKYVPRRKVLRKKRYHHDVQYRETAILRSRQYRFDPRNKEKIQTCKRKLRKKYEANPKWRMIKNLRRRFLFVLHGQRKSDNTLKLIGCNREFLVNYLESKFTDGMTWQNYGRNGWHVDHIRPCESFDMSRSEEQQKCFHYSNLQPLWASDNLLKGNKTSYSSKVS